VQLPAWLYPVVCQLETGQLQYDNFEGRWGDPQHLAAFLQSYAVEKCRLEARRKGHSVSEQKLADGSIKAHHPGERRCRVKIIEVIVSPYR
jgi:hypothetical protein